MSSSSSATLLSSAYASLFDVKYRYVAGVLLILCAVYVVLLDVVLKDSARLRGNAKDVEGYPTGMALSQRAMYKPSIQMVNGRPRPQFLHLAPTPSGPRPHAHRTALTMLYRHNMPLNRTPPHVASHQRSKPPSPLSNSFVITDAPEP